MVGHTGFRMTTRRLAPGVEPPERRRRPSKGMSTEEQWSPEDLGERPVSEKKVRKVRREIGVEAPQASGPPEPPVA